MTNLVQDGLLNKTVNFTRKLIQTPSMSGKEAEIAQLILSEMKNLDFDNVWQDKAGNVFGRVFGQDRSKDSLVLNSHLDHVDPGELSEWSVDPYSATIRGDRIIGRGACDIKGPLAVQIHAMGALKAYDIVPNRNIVFTGVVMEEVGGAGAKYWISELDYQVKLVVLGEPSANNISLGHRGLLQVTVTFRGDSVHASVPNDESNPNYALAKFLSRLSKQKSELSTHPDLGQTSVAPTIVEVDTRSSNVTPAWTKVMLDFRSASESPSSILNFISSLCIGLNYEVDLVLEEAEANSIKNPEKPLAGYYTPPTDPIVAEVRRLVSDGMGWEPDLTKYQFATDGRHFVDKGLNIIGFAPGEEKAAHTADESIPISMMEDSLAGYLNLLTKF